MKNKNPFFIKLTIKLVISCLFSYSVCGQLISAGGGHSMALCKNSTVMSWGYNGWGQLGDSSKIDRYFPVPTLKLTDIVAISAGYGHSLALKNDGTVWAWGHNDFGQSGDSIYLTRVMPKQVYGLNNVVAIAAGWTFSLALKNDGTLWAWGGNVYGQLGDSTTTKRWFPAQVHGLSGNSAIIAIAAGGGQSLALKSDGTVWAWGKNDNGELGDGTLIRRKIPVNVIGLTGITAISGGQSHSLALKNDGTVWAWGWNTYGQLGDSTITDRMSPVKVHFNFSGGIIGIAGGGGHSLALKNDGKIWAWGWNDYGQLGDATAFKRTSPVEVSLTYGGNIIAIAAGVDHSIALRNDGRLWVWGSNDNGEIGNGNGGFGHKEYSPTQVVGLCNIVSIEELNDGRDIIIYPNPLTTSSILQLNTQVKNAEVVIYDMLGKEMVRKKMDGDRMEIEKGSLESGVYFVRVNAEENQLVQKIIIE